MKPEPFVLIPGRCPRCQLQPRFCLCEDLPRIRTGPRIVILRHWRERTKTSNTGRIAALAIEGAVLADYAALDQPFDPDIATRPGSWLVFPAGSLESPDRPPVPTLPAEPPKQLVFLDGTWGQARRMSHRIPGIAELPRLELPPRREGVTRLREPHAPWAMSTIESVGRALEAIGDLDAARQLDEVFDLFVRRVREQGGKRD